MEKPGVVEFKIEFADTYVLARRADAQLPVEALLAQLQKACPDVQVQGRSLTGCTLLANAASATQCEQQLEELLTAQGAGENDVVLTRQTAPAEASPTTETQASEKPSAPQAGENPPADDDDTIGDGDDAEARQAQEKKDRLRRLVGEATQPREDTPPEEEEPAAQRIQALIGAAALKALSEELIQVAPRILRRNTQAAFAAQCYLFSIGEGCGLSTGLSLLARQIDELGLYAFRDAERRVEEIEVREHPDDGFEDAMVGRRSGRLVCFDISRWIDRVDSVEFRTVLQTLSTYQDGRIFAFRIPFVDNGTRQNILRVLSDMFFVREVAFPPFSMEELRRHAAALLDGYGLSMQDDAWTVFDERIIAEKSDGNFYGLRTVKKVVDEFIYKKHLHDASTGASEDSEPVISAQEVALPRQTAGGASAMDQLNALIGIGPVRDRILEIIAQMELAKKDPGAARPSLHMQFLGGPGTGKTTVARILGKLLQERGLLSKGLFFEYAGRDFCGRYVGETAPKTAAMCRDAYGSVLFIDEAYSLYRGGPDSNDYGREAVDTLIAQMENHRDDLLVVMAGYEDDMQTLMEANVGLSSRVPYSITFENYGRADLAAIFMSMVEGRFDYDQNFKKAAGDYFASLPEGLLTSRSFANARFVRNLFERTWAKAATRCQLEPDAPFRLIGSDFDKAAAEREFAVLQERKLPRLGFA